MFAGKLWLKNAGYYIAEIQLLTWAAGSFAANHEKVSQPIRRVLQRARAPLTTCNRDAIRRKPAVTAAPRS